MTIISISQTPIKILVETSMGAIYMVASSAPAIQRAVVEAAPIDGGLGGGFGGDPVVVDDSTWQYGVLGYNQSTTLLAEVMDGVSWMPSAAGTYEFELKVMCKLSSKTNGFELGVEWMDNAEYGTVEISTPEDYVSNYVDRDTYPNNVSSQSNTFPEADQVHMATVRGMVMIGATLPTTPLKFLFGVESETGVIATAMAGTFLGYRKVF
jgi:hypothetical protein